MTSGKFKDLTGERFGKLTVIKRAEDHVQPSGKRRIMWLCKCDCGNMKSIQAVSLTRGITKSCGCYNLKDLTGQRFGRLTVIRRVKK